MKKLLFPKTYLKAIKSTVSHAMVNSIIYSEKLDDNQYIEWLSRFNQKPGEEKCVYCSEKATTVDHLHPIVDNKMPSGYNTERNNMVPCCASCNAKKRNLTFDIFFETKLDNTVPKHVEKYQVIKEYADKYPAKYIDFQTLLNDKYNDPTFAVKFNKKGQNGCLGPFCPK